MAGPVLGRLLVTLSSSSGDPDATNVAQYYRSIYDFLKVQVEPAGYVTEIANGGSSGSTVDPGAFSLWRWNINVERNWPWYMLVQMSSGSTIPASRLPVRVEGSVSPFRNVGFAAAVGVEYQTGSYSFFNPWNGTTGSFGSDTKGNPVWGLTASNPLKERNLFILPRSNVSGSSFLNSAGTSIIWSERSDLMAIADGTNGKHPNGIMLNMWADQDSFLVTVTGFPATEVGHVFLGTYRPIPSLSSSIPAPLIGYRRRVGSNNPLFDADYDLANDTRELATMNVFPFFNAVSSTNSFKSTSATGFIWPEAYREIFPNRQVGFALGSTSSNIYDSPTIFLDRMELPSGLIGTFDSQLLGLVAGVGGATFRWGTTNSGSSGQRRAFFPADDSLTTNGSYSVIWSGSFQPGTGSGTFTTISGGFRF